MPDSAIAFTRAEVSAYYTARVPHLTQPPGREWRGPCPVHRGKNPNFAVQPDTGFCYCHSQCARGWDILKLEMDLARVDFKAAKGRSLPAGGAE